MADPRVSADLQAKLGKELRRIFTDVQEEPIPKRFLDLLPPDDTPPAGAPMRARISRYEICNVRAMPLLRA